MDHKMVSLADQVFDELEKAILNGTYQREEILTEARLCDELGVSRTPVREAMYRLSQEHLIDLSVKGAKVIGVTEQDIEDIYNIRLRIEGLASYLAAKKITEEGIQELQRTLDLQEFYTQKGEPEGIKNMDDSFHQAIYRLCGSPALRYTLEPLHRRIVKYRKASFSTRRRAENSLQEHFAIFDAIRNQNAELAEKLTIKHIENAKNNIISGGNATCQD